MEKQETGIAGETFAERGSYSVAGRFVAETRRRSGIEDYQMQLEWPVERDCRATAGKEARE